MGSEKSLDKMDKPGALLRMQQKYQTGRIHFQQNMAEYLFTQV